MRQLSVVSPAYNEAGNLPEVYERLRETLDGARLDWEWIVVDDHSVDNTFEVLQTLASRDDRVHGLRLSRNSGSHSAIRCAIHHSTGQAVALLASDLEDPPEVLLRMWAEWQRGAHVVWAVRGSRPGVRSAHAGFARTYYWVMRTFGRVNLPPTGTDCFMLDRVVASALNGCGERNTSVFALLSWLGFRQTHIDYDKGMRVRGQSGWSFTKKVRLMIDSLVGFSDALLEWLRMACLGAAVGAILAVVLAVMNVPLHPWATLIIALVLTAVHFAALWAIAQYIWRVLDEARGRPIWVVERATSVLARPEARLQ